MVLAGWQPSWFSPLPFQLLEATISFYSAFLFRIALRKRNAGLHIPVKGSKNTAADTKGTVPVILLPYRKDLPGKSPGNHL